MTSRNLPLIGAIRGRGTRWGLAFLAFLVALPLLGPQFVGLAYNNLGRIELARAMVAAGRTPPQAADEFLPHMNQSEALLQIARRWQPERAQFKSSLTRLYMTRGQMFSSLGAWDEAINSYEMALELDQDLASANERIGEILAYNKPHEKQYLDKAVAHLDRAAFLSPSSEYIRIVLGHALWFSGRRDEAIAALKDSVSVSPSGYSWSVLGSFYLEVKDWDPAIAALRNALALEPGRTDAWFTLGEAYQGKGAREEALEAWRRVVELAPGSELGRSAASKMSNPGR